jgi:hypothetical protein
MAYRSRSASHAYEYYQVLSFSGFGKSLTADREPKAIWRLLASESQDSEDDEMPVASKEAAVTAIGRSSQTARRANQQISVQP